MEGSSWPKKIYKWTPHGWRGIGISQQSLKNQVTDFEKLKHGRRYGTREKSLAF